MNVAVNDKVIIRVGSHTYSGQVLHFKPDSSVLTHLILLDEGQLIANSPLTPKSIKTYIPGQSNLGIMIRGSTIRRKIRPILDRTVGPKYLVWVPSWEILSVYESDLTLKEIINQLDEEVL